jgi:4-alpha-glucanotransferase
MGDLGDLAAFARWAGSTGAGFVQLNPLHAVAPTFPVQASPYSPSSRRFTSPLYLRVADTDAYRAATAEARASIDAMRPDEAAATIDYDAVWRVKKQALELLFATSDPADDDDADLVSFATFCALAERYGPDWRSWPVPLRQPGSAAVSDAARELAPRVAFYAWLQRLCQQQLDAASRAAHGAGMPIGIVHDLAVGVDPGGADAWMLADVLVDGVRVGAPPDSFNQLGQDWGLAAWHPTRLAETGYAAYRDLLRRTLRHAGGIRIDHIAGLFRLWWIPPGSGAAGGTYVSYDAEAMLGILTLEAYRADAVVIGEDLGTVPPTVTDGLHERAMLGSTVLWFAREGAGPQAAFTPPARWPRHALASISTHDLPTAYGYLAGEHIRVRADLNLLAGSAESEQKQADAERAMLLGMLGRWLPSGDDPVPEDIVAAMHAALVASPSLLVAASLYDVVGELRQPNLPGTVDQYPNWRLPLPESLEELVTDARVARIARLLSAGRTR